MTTRKNLKRLVRARAAKTGESYTTALRHVRSHPTEDHVSDTPTTNFILCSFCNKTQKEVKKLIAGPGVYICEECIALCNDIIDEDSEATAEAEAEAKVDPRENQLRRVLPMLATMAAKTAEQLESSVRGLRESGTEWAEIGSALGLSEDDARQRFGPSEQA